MIQLSLRSKNFAIISNPTIPKAEKEALLILVGFGSKTHNVKKIATYFSNKGYDLFQPDFICRKSIAKGISKLDDFVEKEGLKSYKKLHVFCYIIGGWTFNQWLTNTRLPNLASVIFDRSPLQERAPKALMIDLPIIIRLLVGNVIRELAETPYPPMNKGAVKIGILIETEPTKVILNHKKAAATIGPLKWDVASLQQEYDDYCYVPLNHDDFYSTFELIGSMIFPFLKEGVFPIEANRIKPTNNPLQPLIDK